MTKIKTFVRTFINSFKPNYYADVVKAKAAFSWKYFTMLSFVSALGVTVVIGVVLFRFNVGRFSDRIVGLYPQDLVVDVVDGRVAINQPLPYRIPIRTDFLGLPDIKNLDEFVDMKDISYLVTFDSDDHIKTARDFLDTKSMAVVTESNFYMLEDFDTQEVKLYPIPQSDQPVKVDVNTIHQVKQMILDLPFIKYRLYLPVILGFALVFMFIGVFISRLVMIAFYSLLVKLLMVLLSNKVKLSYGKVFQIGLHSVTPVMVVAYFGDILRFRFWSGWCYLIIFVGWTLFVISKLKPARSNKGKAVSAGKSKKKFRSKTTKPKK